MLFQTVCNFQKFLIAFRQVFFQSGNGLRCTDSCNNVLTLCVDQIFAINTLCSGGGISRKGNACTGGIAHISEYHRLYIDCSSPVPRNVIHSSVYDSSFIIPRTEYRLYRFHQLNPRLLRKFFAHFFLIDLFKTPDHLF